MARPPRPPSSRRPPPSRRLAVLEALQCGFALSGRQPRQLQPKLHPDVGVRPLRRLLLLLRAGGMLRARERLAGVTAEAAALLGGSGAGGTVVGGCWEAACAGSRPLGTCSGPPGVLWKRRGGLAGSWPQSCGQAGWPPAGNGRAHASRPPTPDAPGAPRCLRCEPPARPAPRRPQPPP